MKAARTTRAIVGVAIFTALIASMCAAPTEIVVDVYTEVDCAKTPQIGFTGGPNLSSLAGRALTSISTSCNRHDVPSGRVVLRPSGADDETIAFAVVTHIDGENVETCSANKYEKCIVVRRQIRFVPHQSTRVEVHLRTDCIGKSCADDQTCNAEGTCVSADLPASCVSDSCTEVTPGDGGQAGEGGGATDGGAPSEGGPLEASVEAGAGGPVVAGRKVFGVNADSTYLYWSEEHSVAPLYRVQRARHTDLGASNPPTQLIATPASPARGLTFAISAPLTGDLVVATGSNCYRAYDLPGDDSSMGTQSGQGSNVCTNPLAVSLPFGANAFSWTEASSGQLSFVGGGCAAPNIGYLKGSTVWGQGSGSSSGVYRRLFSSPATGSCSTAAAHELDTSAVPGTPYGVTISSNSALVCATFRPASVGGDEHIACGPENGAVDFVQNLGPGRGLEDAVLVDRLSENKVWLYWGAKDGLWRTAVTP